MVAVLGFGKKRFAPKRLVHAVQIAAQIARRSSGNPLFIEALEAAASFIDNRTTAKVPRKPPHHRETYCRKTHCHNGHEFTDTNTYTYPNDLRRCRTCQRENQTLFRSRH